jgi:ribonucleoside-diphosphate reductase alpha chain
MMAAAQPFLSGAISKTVNMPREATVEDIRNAYLEGWTLGLKALAIYRDGSKESQPVSTTTEEGKTAQAAEAKSASASPVVKAAVTDEAPAAITPVAAPVPSPVLIPVAAVPTVPRPRRERLPDTRTSMTHKFDIQGHEGYLTVGFFADGRPGELFITMAKEGSTVGGLMDVVGTLVSMGLQYGVPLDVFVNKFAHSRFEPAGFTKNPDIPIAKSITDYIFRWLGIQFVPGYREANVPKREPLEEEAVVDAPVVKVNGHRKATVDDLDDPEALHSPHLSTLNDREEQQEQFAHFQSDAPACDNCGALTVRCGTCYRCFNCGNSMGCS